MKNIKSIKDGDEHTTQRIGKDFKRIFMGTVS